MQSDRQLLRDRHAETSFPVGHGFVHWAGDDGYGPVCTALVWIFDRHRFAESAAPNGFKARQPHGGPARRRVKALLKTTKNASAFQRRWFYRGFG